MSNLDLLKDELKKLGVASVIYDTVEQMEEDMIADEDDLFDVSETSYDLELFSPNDPVIALDLEKLFADNSDDIATIFKFNESFNRNLQTNLKLQNPLLTESVVENLAYTGMKADSVAKKVKAVIKGTAMSCGLSPKFG